MADPKIKYDIEAGVSGLADVAKLEAELRDLGGTLDGDLKRQALAAADSLQALGARQKDASAAFAASKTAIDGLQASIRTAATNTNAFATAERAIATDLAAAKKELAGQTDSLARLKLGYDAGKVSAEQFKTESLAIKTAILDSKKAITDKAAALDDASKRTKSAVAEEKQALDQLTAAEQRQAAAARAAAEEITAGARRGSASLKDLKDQTEQAKTGASGLGEAFSRIGPAVAAIGASIAGYFGISSFASAVKGAADLEAKLSEVKAITGATAEQMTLLRKAAEDAGATTKYTATQAAEALSNLGRAGLDATKSIEALPAVLQLAQAGGIELGQAAEYVAKTVNGLGLQFSEAGRVADVLAAGANASNTSVSGLAQAMSYAAPLAKSLGLGLETTVAIIGKFADAGIDASRAGTALNAILAQFSDPASRFRQELAAAGVTTGNFDQALRGLAASGLRGEKAILAVGTEAGPALRALLNQGIGALDDLKGKLDNAAGSAAATAAVMNDNLAGAALGLSSAWDTVKNALATPVLPVLKDAVGELAGALRAAVADGAVGRFGESLATGFKNALAAAREFIGQIDFAALSAQANTLAADLGAAFASIGEKAKTAGDITQTAYGVMAAGANTVLGAVYKIGQAFSDTAAVVQRAIALMLEDLSKVSFGDLAKSFKAAADEVRRSAEATGAAADDLGRRAEQAFVRTADAAQGARDAFGRLADSAQSANTRTAQSAIQVANAIDQTAAAAANAAQAVQGSAEQQQRAVETTRVAVAGLKREYQAAIAAGDTQRAAEALQAMKQALDSTAAAAGNLAQQNQLAAAKVKEVADAYTALGITSQASLKGTADAAQVFYQRIRDSGTASAADIGNAFKAFAEKAIAANDGVATEALKLEAAISGVEITTDAAGNAMVRMASKGGAALDTLPPRLSNVARGYSDVTDEIERQIAAQEKQNALAERADALERKRLGIDKQGFSVDSSGARINVSTPTQRSVYEQAKGQGLTEDQALTIARQFVSEMGQQTGYGGADFSKGQNWATELQKAIDKLVLQNADQTASSARAVSTKHTVNLNLSGGTGAQIATASAGDSEKLTAFLKQLQDSAARAA